MLLRALSVIGGEVTCEVWLGREVTSEVWLERAQSWVTRTMEVITSKRLGCVHHKSLPTRNQRRGLNISEKLEKVIIISRR